MSEYLIGVRLGRLQRAVREHIAEVDGLMKGPASYERGQKIAQSIVILESALLDSQSTSPGSAGTPDGSSPEAKKPSSPAASGKRPSKRSKG